MNYQFRNLNADEIEVRQGKKGSLLLYKNARIDMQLLDEFVGQGRWQRDHKELKGNIYCGVSIYDPELGAWITRWDAGTESNIEAEKGEASDSFKRACVNWGIGRALYQAPYIPCDEKYKFDKFRVSSISYTEDGSAVASVSIERYDSKAGWVFFGTFYNNKLKDDQLTRELVMINCLKSLDSAKTFDDLKNAWAPIPQDVRMLLVGYKDAKKNLIVEQTKTENK